MNPRYAGVLGWGAAIWLLGCGAPATPTAPTAPSTAEQVLRLPAGDKGRTLAQLGFTQAALSTRGVPAYLGGRVPTALRDAEDARALLVGTLGHAYRLAPGTDLRLLNQTRGSGHRWLRLQQVHQGLPVVQGHVVVQVAEDDAVVAVLGTLVPDLPDLSAAPPPAAGIARAIAALSPGRSPTVHQGPSAVVWAPAGAAPRRVQRALVSYAGPGFTLEEIFLDEATGQVVARLPHVYEKLDRALYDISCFGGYSDLPGKLVLSEGGTPSGDSATAAYETMGTTYWMYRQLLDRDSLDDDGLPLWTAVDAGFSDDGCTTGANAFWIGAPYNQAVFGKGDGQRFKPLARATDVVGHEFTHGVTEKTSGLIYSGESGGLNEALSDIFGAGAKAWRAAGGTSTHEPDLAPDEHTWKAGEEIAGPALPGGALRFLNDPAADSRSLDLYDPNRSVDVHYSSGIANLAFYLLSQGGKHPRGKTATTVTGVGMKSALRIFGLANTALMVPSTNFAGARLATAQAARTLFGDCSDEVQSTHRAWEAVGVPGSYTPCGTRDDAEAPKVQLTGVSAGARLSGAVTLTATATDNVGVTQVEFYRGTALLGVARAAPYQVTWDTTQVADRSCWLQVRARDAAGNLGTSAQVTVEVANLARLGEHTDEVEPNDSAAQANRAQGPGLWLGVVSGATDVDHVRVDLGPGRTLRAQLTSPSGRDYDLFVYDEAGALLGSSQRELGLLDEVQVENRGFRTHARYVQVKGFLGSSGSRPYQLRLSY